MAVDIQKGYPLLLTYNELIALCRAIHEYARFHDIQDRENVQLEELQTLLFLYQIVMKLPEIEE